jgi:multiple sugar transport system permease protein
VPLLAAARQTARSGGLVVGVARAFVDGPALHWFGNSLAVTGVTVVASILIGAPAGYVLSRAKGRVVDAFALVVFALQALPTVILVVPIYLLFISVRLSDTLVGIGILYVGLTAAVATWTMASAIDSVPRAIEEAAWLDGCSVLGGFFRVVLPNAASGVLATAILTFLFAWNEYLVAVTFLISEGNYTVALGVVSGRVALLSIAAMLPPVIVFLALHRFFRFGGMAGAVVG